MLEPLKIYLAGPNVNPQITQISQINSRKNTQNTQNRENYKTRTVGGSVAEDLFERGLCLPSGTAMTEGDLNRVIDTIIHARAC